MGCFCGSGSFCHRAVERDRRFVETPRISLNSSGFSARQHRKGAYEYANYSYGGWGKAAGTETNNTAKPWDRMVVRTATLDLTVKDVGVAVD